MVVGQEEVGKTTLISCLTEAWHHQQHCAGVGNSTGQISSSSGIGNTSPAGNISTSGSSTSRPITDRHTNLSTDGIEIGTWEFPLPEEHQVKIGNKKVCEFDNSFCFASVT